MNNLNYGQSVNSDYEYFEADGLSV